MNFNSKNVRIFVKEKDLVILVKGILGKTKLKNGNGRQVLRERDGLGGSEIFKLGKNEFITREKREKR